MSRSVQRSKCRRGGCLLCCPWKATGERPVSEQRASMETIRELAQEDSRVTIDREVEADPDHVPLGYWERLGRAVDELQMLDEGEVDDDAEPFV